MEGYQAYTERCHQILRELIAIDSSHPEGSEKRMVDKIKTYFPSETEMTEVRHTETRSSLVVRIPGREPGPALAFAGHIDTVAFGEESAWEHPPLSADEEGDLIYGRGSSDMKSGVAALTTTALYLLENKLVPKHDILFCYTADEEARGMGITAVVAQGFLENVSEVIIAEPSCGRISVCEKGAFWLRAEATGILSHGSRPEIGVSAIDLLIDLRDKLAAYLDTGYSNPYLGGNTISLTKLCGGIQTNVIPDKAVMELDIRTVQKDVHRGLKAAAERAVKEVCEKRGQGRKGQLDIVLSVLNDRAMVETSEEADIVKKMTKIWADKGEDVRLRGTIFYTDMSQITPVHDIPFIIFGPGDEGQAHQTNECASLTSLRTVTEAYLTYVTSYCL